jgi:hypothetical protein
VSASLTARIVPLFVGFFGLMVVGLWLRRSARASTVPSGMSAALTTLVLDVTAPCLVLDVLLQEPLSRPLALCLVAPTVALLSTLGLARGAALVLRVDRPTAGAMVLTAAFANTGFMGIPVAQGLQPDQPMAAQAAVVIDTVDTTVLLWTLGAALAAHFGDGRSGDLCAVLRALLVKPLTWSVLLGLTLNPLGVSLPWWLRPGIARAGAATGPLVFVLLGLNVDLARLRGQGPALASAVVLRLLVAPSVALAVAWAIGLRGPLAWAGVMQSAMPTALAATVLVAQYRGDTALASGVCAVGTVLSPLTLTAWAMVAERLSSPGN